MLNIPLSYHKCSVQPSTMLGPGCTKKNKVDIVPALEELVIEQRRPALHWVYAEVGQDVMGAFNRGLPNLFGF